MEQTSKQGRHKLDNQTLLVVSARSEMQLGRWTQARPLDASTSSVQRPRRHNAQKACLKQANNLKKLKYSYFKGQACIRTQEISKQARSGHYAGFKQQNEEPGHWTLEPAASNVGR